ncbi:MAG TPA: pyridoxal phosphate-dependent aminotransferase [Firmicutes bacterium]|nr:pyridoxal phosphate-dependent aminotransferase [Bacillota bacterium]
MSIERIARMTPSVTIVMEGIVADLKAQGVDVIGLNAGEPDFDTPAHIVQACTRAMEEGKTRYINVTGIPQLRQAICQKLQKDNGAVYTPAQICVSTGAKQALNNAILTTVQPGDEVIIPKPCWVSYVEIVKLADGVPVLVDTDPATFQLDLEAISRAITPRTRAILLNTPNNPTGAVYTRESLEALGRLAVEHDFYIISDEVYEKLIYGSGEHVSPASLGEEVQAHTIVVNGFSKAYAMTGWRIGYTAAPPDIAKDIAALQGHTTSNSTTFVQWAALAALEGPQDELERMRREFDRRRLYMVERLRKMPGITCPDADGAFYLMPDVSSYYGKTTPGGQVIADSAAFCNYILEEAHVAFVPGAAFEIPSAVRIAYSNSLEKIREGMDRMEAALAKLS